MADGNERRVHSRVEVRSNLWIQWGESGAIPRRVRGRMLDISTNGTKVLLHCPIASGTPVIVGIPVLRTETKAIVRRCKREQGAYAIGIEFLEMIEDTKTHPLPLE